MWKKVRCAQFQRTGFDAFDATAYIRTTFFRKTLYMASRFILILLTVLSPLFAQAQYTFTTNNGAITIKNYIGPGGPLTLPAMTNGLPVTAIASNAFLNSSLTTVLIPASITNIQGLAFISSTFLTNFTVNGANPSYSGDSSGILFNKNGSALVIFPPGLTNTTYAIPTNVTRIEDYAFTTDNYLTGMHIPTNVTSIGLSPFYDCVKLTNIVVDTPNSNYTSQGGVLFTKDMKTLVEYPMNQTNATYTVPSGVTNIADYSLAGAIITNVIFPNSLISVGNDAFQACLTLTNVTFGNALTAIGYQAFSDCGMSQVTLPASLRVLGPSAFILCTKLKSVNIPDGVTSMGSNAFFFCTALTNISVPASVTNIVESPFGFCSALTNISVDALNPVYTSVNGVLFNKSETTLIQYPAGETNKFYAIPSTVTNIGNNAFIDSVSLTNVIIPDSVNSTGFGSFDACLGLLSVTIGTGMALIADSTFITCPKLTNITFNGNAPTVGNSVFSGHAANATVYYLPGKTGWGPTFGGLPTALLLPGLTIINAGIHTNQFGFTFSGTNGQVIVVEATTNLVKPNWVPIQTNTSTGNPTNFVDSHSSQFLVRFYRLHAH